MCKENSKIQKEQIKVASLGKVSEACVLPRLLKAESLIIMVSKEQQKQCSATAFFLFQLGVVSLKGSFSSSTVTTITIHHMS